MKLRFLLAFVINSICFFSYGQTKPLYFVNGANQKFSVCQNSSGFDFSSYLTTYEATIGKFLSYTPLSETQNGSFTNIPKTYKNGTQILTPSNTVYAPPTDFSGTDIFVIQVSDGTNTATTTFTVTINPLPTVSAIIGNTISCGTGSNNLYNTTGNGVWTSDNTQVSTVDTNGRVTPITAGSANIGYTITDSKTGCVNTATVAFVVSGPPNLNGSSGTANTCVGSTTQYFNATPLQTGYTTYWTSNNKAVATVDSSTGIITGVSAGVAGITYTVVNNYGCSAGTRRNVTIATSPVADTIGYTTKSVCVGSTIVLTNATRVGFGVTRTWSSSNNNAIISNGVGAGGASAENVLGAIPGTDSIFFKLTSGGCTSSSSIVVTINPKPVIGAISGTANICTNNTVQFSDTTTGGKWTSNKTTVATIDSINGLLTALSAGNSTIRYTVKNSYGCSDSVPFAVTVSGTSALSPITGSSTICIGSSTTFSNGTFGGTWSSSNPKIATIDNTGLVSGKSTGADTIYYTYASGGCTQVASFPINVASSVAVAPIQGAASVCMNGNVTLTNATADPTSSWSSSNQNVALVDNNGNITTISPGVVTIQYTIGSGSCMGTASKNFIVYDLPALSDNSISDTALCVGSFVRLKNDSIGGVWNTTSASATVDSTGLVTAVTSTGQSSVISYSITDKHGCYNAAVTTIGVNPVPNKFTITGSNSTCYSTSGSSITYTTNLPAGQSAKWSSSNSAVIKVINTGTVTNNTNTVKAVGIGTANLYCVASNGYCTRIDTLPVTILAKLQASEIVGLDNLCMGTNATFTDSTSSGIPTWTLTPVTGGTANLVASGASVVLTPVTTGTATIRYVLNGGSNACSDTVYKSITINDTTAIKPITITPTPTNYCSGSTYQFTNATTGGKGIWTSGTPAVAIIDSTSGLLTAISNPSRNGQPTTDIISYTFLDNKGCTSRTRYSVPVSSGGNLGTITLVGAVSPICANNTYNLLMTLTNPNRTGSWSSTKPLVASVDSISTTSAKVSGLTSGSTVIQYQSPARGGFCPALTNFNLNVSAVPIIVPNTGGDTVLCVGQATQLYNASPTPSGAKAGVWSSSDSKVVTVNAYGLVSAVGAGSASIYYTETNVSAGLCSNYTSTNFKVNAVPTVANITSASSDICVGSSIKLSDLTSGGVWGINDSTIATINAQTGDVTGISAGSVIVTYSVTDPNTNCTSTVFGNGNVIALPNIEAITGPTNACFGSTTQLFDATPQGTWSSSDNSIATVSSAGLVTPKGSGKVVISYSYTNPTYGCSNLVTDSIAVGIPPTVAPITGNNVICSSGMSILSNATTGGTWSSTNNAVATVDANGVVSPVSFGTDSIKYTLVDSASNCSTSSVLVVTVNPTPVASFSVNNASQCLSGNYFVFNNTSTISSGSLNYSWTIDGKTVSSFSPTYTFTTPGTYTVKLVVTSLTGCSDSATQTVTVYPQSNLEFSVNNNSQCLIGNSFIFSNTSSISSGTSTYNWNFGDNSSIVTSASSSYTYGKAGTFNVILTSSTDFGCIDSISQAVSIAANVIPTVSIKASSSNICTGASVVFTASSVNGGSTPSYEWHKNGSVVGTGITYTDTALVNGDSVYTILTTSTACYTSLTAQSSKIGVAVTTYVLPRVSIATPSTTICSETSTTFTASPVNGGSTPSYQWLVNGNSVGTGLTYTSSSFADKDVVSVILTSSANCVLSRSVNSNLINLAVKTSTSSTTNYSICAGTYFTFNGITYDSAGTYVAHLKNSIGCDSTATLILAVKYATSSTTKASICNGDSYLFNGTNYKVAGSYTIHLLNSLGCDSSATLVLTVNQPSTSSTNISACSSYTWNGSTYTKGGTYTFITKNAVGCDSTASLMLTINQPSTSSASVTACSSYTWNGTTYTKSGNYTYVTKNAVGCDSTATLVLTINQPSTSSTSITACSSYTWNGSNYTKSGSYNFVTKNAVGCDSTATLILTINQPSTSSTSIAACSSYSWNGSTYTNSGTYTFITKNAVGCDSTATLKLTISQPSTSSNSITACSSYSWNGITYTKSGTYTYVTKNFAGCDSTATLLLTINYPSTSSTSITACSSYSWNGTTYTKSGSYNYVTKNALGCDSTATLILTINQPSTSSTSITACSSYDWNGNTYTKSGNYMFVTKNAVGCDSTATLVLTVNYPSTSSTSITACSSYTWNGTTYTKSGAYTYLTKNAVGCDSTATLILTVNNPSTSSTSITSCDSYFWNGFTYTKSGTYTYVTKNAVGCDSTATLLLTVNYASTSSTSITACSSYTWNGTTYTKSGSYTYATKNAVGCDSTATLLLTVNYPSTSTTTASICAGNTYTFNGSTYDSAGTYLAHLTNAVGCDSAATLVLSVRYPSSSITKASICAGNTYSFNGKSYDVAGTYVAHLTNAVGCDSAATLILTVNALTSSTTNLSICPSELPYKWNGLNFIGAGSQTAHLINGNGCDSAATLVLSINQPTSSSTKLSICSSELPYTWNGLTFTGAGSLTAHLTNAVGCDSAATLVLTVNPVTTSTTSMSICPSSLPYTWNGLTFTDAGTQSAHLTNSKGCDSVATLILSLNPTSASTINASICAGASYSFNGKTYDSAGTYVAHLTNSFGCDSAATLVLTVKYPTSSTTSNSICAGNGYNFNGTIYDSAGTYTLHLTNAVGCDSTATLVLSVKYPSISTTNASIDSGSTYTFNGSVYSNPGTYVSHLTNSVGCDSTAKLILTVINPTSSTTIASICAGSSYMYSGVAYDTAGTFVNHYKNAAGGDSTATLILTVNVSTSSTTTASICAGSGYTFNGTSYDSAGTYTTHLTNSFGCDSIATLVLSVKYPTSSITTASICVAGSYNFNGTAYTAAGTYNVHFTNAAGCDSTATLVLTVNNTVSSMTTASICAGSTYTFNGINYDSAGTYVSHLTSSVGCDSTATLILSVKYPTASTTTASICSGSSYYFNGSVYDVAGTYTAHLTNSVGCDSIATLVLSVKDASRSIANASICSGSTYTFNGITYDSAGTYQAHFVNAVGCDSTATLVLTVNYPTSSTTNAAICSGSSYTFNGSVYDKAGTFVAHLISATGCDSTAILILTVNTSVTSTTTASICAGSSYTFNGSTYDSAGTYVSHLTSAAGCDSAATLVLAVNYPSSSITNVDIKKGDTYTFNGVVYDTVGTYKAHLTNSVGCDSTATLVLTVTDVVPVTLRSFTGYYQSGATNLTWSTATELNVANYTIQRSSNGVDFFSVKSIPATNKLSGATYNYADVISSTGKLYYRLKLVDKSGVSTYSATVVVTVGANYSFSLYPNPVKNVLTLHVTNDKSEKVTIQVVNMLGKQVHQQQTQLNWGATDVTLDVANIAQGNYTVIIKGEHVQQKQFIKL